MIQPYLGPIKDLPKRFQTIYEKRKLENLIKFQLSPKDADLECRQRIAHLMFIEKSKKDSAKDQIPMFPDARLPKVRMA